QVAYGLLYTMRWQWQMVFAVVTEDRPVGSGGASSGPAELGESTPAERSIGVNDRDTGMSSTAVLSRCRGKEDAFCRTTTGWDQNRSPGTGAANKMKGVLVPLPAARGTAIMVSDGDFDRFRPYLLLLAGEQLSARLRGRVGVSDIVQQTMLEAHRSRDQFR